MIGQKVDFFFVGFPKSGTTTFYYLLKSHPEVFTPEIKEVNFFNSDFILEFKRHLGKDHFEFVRNEEQYSSLFLGAIDKLKGDFTPVNIFSADAPKNIFSYNPLAKILISIREPISFLRSFHFQSLYNLIEDEPDFLRALFLEDSRRSGKNIPKYCHNPLYLHYSSLVNYKEYVKRYTDIFGFENVKIILFDDIVKREYDVYRDVLTFLAINDANFIPPQPDRNPSHALRFTWLRKFLFTPQVKKFLYTNTPRLLLPMAVRASHKLFKKKQEKPFVSEQDINMLKKRFKYVVDDLNLFLNESYSLNLDLHFLWGY